MSMVSASVQNRKKSENDQGMISNEFILDSKMQSTEYLTDEEEKLLAENADQIAEIYRKAKEMWPNLPLIEG